MSRDIENDRETG